MDTLKILALAYDFNPKEIEGTYKTSHLLGWKLVEQLSRYYDVWVITHNLNREDVLEALGEGALPNVRIHFVDLPFAHRTLCRTEVGKRICQFVWEKRAWKYVKTLLRDIHFDAIHHLTPRFDWIPCFMGAYLQIPFIWGPLGDRKLLYAARNGKKTLAKSFHVWSLKSMQYLGRAHRARKKCIQNARAILVYPEEMRSKFPEEAWQKMHYFPWTGISSKNLPPRARTGSIKESFNVLAAQSAAAQEGFLPVVQAFKVFQKNHPKANLWLMGVGAEKAEIEKFAQENKMKSKLKLYPWMPRHQLREYLHKCDVFVCPHSNDESVALYIESLASGLPVVGLVNGESSFHIQPEWGFSIASENLEQVTTDIAEALEKLNKKTLYGKMSRAGRKYIKDNHVWDQLGKKLESIYAEALLQEESVRFTKKGKGRFFY